MDRLRDEIVKWLYNETTLLEVECEAAGDGLLPLLDAQRCEWTEEDGIVQTGCGTELWFDDIVDAHYVKQCPFCPCCGRRMEVPDGSDGRIHP